jgi:AcrR family transcriptional regulator
MKMGNPLEKRKSETRSIIINAARKVFSEKGYHKAQVSDIVQEAGISTGSIYAHFRDKRDLFEQISKENLENLRLKLLGLRKTKRPDDIIERIERWKLTYSAFFDFISENPQQFLMIIRGGFGVDEAHDETLWAFYNAFAQDITRDFRKWIDLGYLQGLNPSLMGHIAVGMCLQAGHSYLLEKKFSRREVINTLMAMNHAMFSCYLTEKGREELGEIRAPQITEDEV